MFVCPECGASQPAPGQCANDRWQLAPVGEDVLLGTTVGAYRVARLLGVGGMGRVYKGVQPQIGSRVAIKVLSRECSDRRDLVERFFSEARAVNLIRHESIVNVLDLASLPDGRPYIIMEYLDGAPLSSAIESGPLPLGSVARLAIETLDALGAAHAKGIVHRDLKPDNLYVTPSGRPKVLDFGIAKLLPELGGSYTQTGSLLGTPHYMSPEQAAGRSVDYRADLYAMGVILFECVTGTKPFHGNSLFDLLRKQVDMPPPPPASLRPDLPPAFGHVILTALAKAPDQRWPSAQAMSAALQQAVAQLSPEHWAPLTAGSTGAMRTPSGAPWTPAPGGSAPGMAPGGSAPGMAPGGSAPGMAPGGSVPGFAPGGSAPGFVPGGSVPGMAPGVAPGSVPGMAPGSWGAGAVPQRALPHPTTVSGQAGVPVAAKSRGGLWIALAILVAGGGITASVIGSRHGATPAPSPPASPYLQPAAPTQIVTTPSQPAGKWPVYQPLQVPNWDPKNVDVDGFIAWATAAAKRTVPDAQLFRIDVLNVYADGHADLTLSNSGFIGVRFLSPSRSQRDPSIPIGAQQSWRCMFQIMATVQTGPFIAPMDGVSCETERPQASPRCTTRGVWQQMIAHKAPSGNAVAQLAYFSLEKGKPAEWYTSISGTFGQRLPDACP
ncbi:MAG TPA: protein kinase [Kofleriaceae bacterium]|nr:protein kinase [Kofleriaceae bacterium]